MSTLRCTNIADTSGSNSLTTAQIYNGAAKAWVNFNGTSTVAIRAQFNVSSITDNGTGDYTVNFSTAMADANYTASGGAGNENTDDRIISPMFYNQAPTTTALRLRTTNNSGVALDVSRITLNVHR